MTTERTKELILEAIKRSVPMNDEEKGQKIAGIEHYKTVEDKMEEEEERLDKMRKVSVRVEEELKRLVLAGEKNQEAQKMITESNIAIIEARKQMSEWEKGRVDDMKDLLKTFKDTLTEFTVSLGNTKEKLNRYYYKYEVEGKMKEEKTKLEDSIRKLKEEENILKEKIEMKNSTLADLENSLNRKSREYTEADLRASDAQRRYEELRLKNSREEDTQQARAYSRQAEKAEILKENSLRYEALEKTIAAQQQLEEINRRLRVGKRRLAKIEKKGEEEEEGSTGLTDESDDEDDNHEEKKEDKSQPETPSGLSQSQSSQSSQSSQPIIPSIPLSQLSITPSSALISLSQSLVSIDNSMINENKSENKDITELKDLKSMQGLLIIANNTYPYLFIDLSICIY
jgi:hypothetical protein